MKKLVTSPIGIDLGAFAIKAVQCDASGRTVASASLRRRNANEPIGAEDFERLAGMLYRRGFRGPDALLTVPKAVLTRSSLDLPPLDSGAPIETIARAELARQTRQSPASIEFAWWNAPQPPRHNASTRAIALTCPHEAANALLDAAEDNGLRPVALVSASTAAAGAVHAIAPGRHAAVVDLGWSDATLVVFDEDRIVFERELAACGLARAMRDASQRHGIPEQAVPGMVASSPAHPAAADLIERYIRELTSELRSSIDYLSGCVNDPSPAWITLIGGGASLPGVAGRVEAAVGADTSVADDPITAAASGLARLALARRVRDAA